MVLLGNFNFFLQKLTMFLSSSKPRPFKGMCDSEHSLGLKSEKDQENLDSQ